MTKTATSYLKLLSTAILIATVSFSNLENATAKKEDVIKKLQLKNNDEKGNELKSAKAEFLIRKSENATNRVKRKCNKVKKSFSLLLFSRVRKQESASYANLDSYRAKSEVFFQKTQNHC